MSEWSFLGFAATACIVAFCAGGAAAVFIAYILTPSSDYEQEEDE